MGESLHVIADLEAKGRQEAGTTGKYNQPEKSESTYFIYLLMETWSL